MPIPDANKEFIKAAKSGDAEKLRVLLEANPNVIHARDTDGSTALHCATWKGHQAVVAFLLVTRVLSRCNTAAR